MHIHDKVYMCTHTQTYNLEEGANWEFGIDGAQAGCDIPTYFGWLAKC